MAGDRAEGGFRGGGGGGGGGGGAGGGGPGPSRGGGGGSGMADLDRGGFERTLRDLM